MFFDVDAFTSKTELMSHTSAFEICVLCPGESQNRRPMTMMSTTEPTITTMTQNKQSKTTRRTLIDRCRCGGVARDHNSLAHAMGVKGTNRRSHFFSISVQRMHTHTHAHIRSPTGK